MTGAAALRVPRPRGPVDPAGPRAVGELVRSVAAQPWGQVSASIYETARMVALAPWLVGHAQRVDFLLEQQRPQGHWGEPREYALVPTLSATDALLTVLRGPDAMLPVGRSRIVGAVNRGLRVLFGWFSRTAKLAFPDTPAIELIVPALVLSLNAQLDRLVVQPLEGLTGWNRPTRLNLPQWTDEELLTLIRKGVSAGAAVPDKLLHSLEIVGPDATRVRSVRPSRSTGTIGASPAATAAWLGQPQAGGHGARATRYLRSVVDRSGGPVPSVLPITMFERAWVVNSLAGWSSRAAVTAELVAAIDATLTDQGVAGGDGLPLDADTTSTTLLALAKSGVQRSMDSLWAYEMDTHFCTWIGERTPSATTNAHVLEAFSRHSSRSPRSRARNQAAQRKVALWLVSRQDTDGSWADKWHASPYYATAACVAALTRTAGESAATAVRSAVGWILGSQRADGSWGRWAGTAEETAYAVHALHSYRGGPTGPDRHLVEEALARGRGFLLRPRVAHEQPPLWHDKDLYYPAAVVAAAVLGALRATRPALSRSMAGLPRIASSRASS